MKKIFPIIAILLLAACNTTKSTDRLLSDVWAKDQAIRHQMIRLTKAVTTEGRTELIDSLLWASEEMERIDSANMVVVDSLLHNGLP